MHNILLFKKNPSLCGRFQMRDHLRDRALSRTGFTYNPETLTPLQFKAHIIHSCKLFFP